MACIRAKKNLEAISTTVAVAEFVQIGSRRLVGFVTVHGGVGMSRKKAPPIPS